MMCVSFCVVLPSHIPGLHCGFPFKPVLRNPRTRSPYRASSPVYFLPEQSSNGDDPFVTENLLWVALPMHTPGDYTRKWSVLHNIPFRLLRLTRLPEHQSTSPSLLLHHFSFKLSPQPNVNMCILRFSVCCTRINHGQKFKTLTLDMT